MNTKEKNAKLSASDQIAEFVSKKRVPLVAVVAIVLAAIVIYAVATYVGAKNTEKGLAAVDAITYELTDGSMALEDEELDARRTKAMDDLAEYLAKGGIVGVRANMLAADIAFGRDDFEAALDFWEQAAAKGKRSYTVPLANYNIGVCHEELGDFAAASVAYAKAADAQEFAFAAHARFNEGRTKEACGEYEAAYDAYQKLIDAMPNDTWANLAKSRQIALRVEGRVSR